MKTSLTLNSITGCYVNMASFTPVECKKTEKGSEIETVLVQLRLGHTNITHIYLMKGQTEPPECDRCRVTITVKHLLLECRKYVTIRNKYFRNPTLSDMLAESSDFSIDKLVLYLKETNLFHQI